MEDDKKIIPVYSGSVIEVQKLQHDLEDAGIEVLIKDNEFIAINTGFANIGKGALQLCILETEIEKARPVVEKFKKQFGL